MINRKIKTYDNLIESLDAFDQARPSNFDAGNNGTSNFHNHTSFPNVTGRYIFLMEMISENETIQRI